MTNVDIFEKEQFSLQFLFSLLQVYIVYRVSFIFRLNVFLVSVCTKGFAYLLCCPQRRGLELLAWVVQTLDSAIHRINHYPADSVIDLRNTYPLDSDLSGG